MKKTMKIEELLNREDMVNPETWITIVRGREEKYASSGWPRTRNIFPEEVLQSTVIFVAWHVIENGVTIIAGEHES